MKKFLLKTFLIVLFTFLVGLVLSSLKSVKFYGNTLAWEKLQFFNKNHRKFNTLYLGSSRIYRQLDPAIIDSISKSKSFNFGLPAANFLELRAILEYINAEDLDFVVLEVLPVQNEDELNIDTERSLYYRNFENTRLLLEHNIQQKEYDYISKNIKAYFKNIFYFPKIRRSETDSMSISKHDYLGYQFLDEKKNHRDDRQKFLEDPTMVEKRLKKNQKLKQKFSANSVSVREILEVNKILKEKGVKMILFVPPIHFNSVNLSEFQKNKIPIIDTYSPEVYKDLYKKEHIFDIGHLNRNGSILLSKYFGREFSRINK